MKKAISSSWQIVKTIFCCLLVVSMITGCSKEYVKDDPFSNADIYYLKMVGIADEDYNMLHYYIARSQNIVNTKLYLTSEQFKIEWFYGDELIQDIVGNLSIMETDNEIVMYKGTVGQNRTSVNLFVSYEENAIDSIQYIVDCDEYIATALFTSEKQENSGEEESFVTLDSNGYIEDKKFDDKKPFLESDTYATVIDSFENLFGDKLQPSHKYLDYNKVLSLELKAPAGTSASIKSKDTTFILSWSSLLKSIDEVTATYQTIAKLGKYQEVKPVIFILNDEDPELILYSSYNGETIYNAVDDPNFYLSHEHDNASYLTNLAFSNQFGTSTTKCHHADCNNYISRTGDTWDCEEHANKCLNCGNYIDCDAMYCMDCIRSVFYDSDYSVDLFTNHYGTPTTKCHHADCNNFIANSGDTWDCVEHANRCLNCGKYIDCDAVYCMKCLTESIIGNGNTCIYIEEDGSYCGAPVTTYKSLCDKHYKELYDEWGQYLH